MKQYYLICMFLGIFSLKGQTSYSDTYFFKSVYDTYMDVPIFMKAAPLENFTVSSIYFHTKKGNLRLAQLPAETMKFGIESYGLHQEKKFLFFGNFNIYRDLEYNKKWNLSYTNIHDNGIMPNPHYYAVSKGSNWKNQNYDILGGLSAPIIDNMLDFSFSLNYLLKEKYRTEYDPRPKIKFNKLKAKSELALNIDEKQKLALGASFAEMNVNNTISFSDIDSQNPSNYEKFLRWQLGYGTFQLPTSTSTRHKQKQYGVLLGYHYSTQNKKWLYFAEYIKEITDTYQNKRENNKKSGVMATSFSDYFVLKVNHLNEIYTNNFIKLEGRIYNKNSHNKLAFQNGKSYSSTDKYIHINISLLKKEKGVRKELFFGGWFESLSQKDAISQTKKRNQNIRLLSYFSNEFIFKSIVFNPSISITYLSPVENKLLNNNDVYKESHINFSTKTIRLFYDEVIYPDYSYFNNNQYGFEIGNEIKKRINDKLVAIGVWLHYKTNFIGKDMFYISCKLSFFY